MGPARDGKKPGMLRAHGTLNPRPESVRAELFTHEFFDPRDLLQVKYEMLRAVEHEDRAVSEVAVQFGLSRPAFYRAKRDFLGGGLAGLSPHKRGPKAPRKVTPEILDFVRQLPAAQRLPADRLRERVAAQFGVRVHARTIQRTLKHLHEEKKGHRR